MSILISRIQQRKRFDINQRYRKPKSTLAFDTLAHKSSMKSYQHVFTWLHWLETDERNLHGQDGTQNVDLNKNKKGRARCVRNPTLNYRWVGHIDSMREVPGEHQCQHMQRNQVDQKDITTPWGNHVEVRQCTRCCPHHGSGLHGFDPEVVGQQHTEDGNGFVIVWASNRTRDITGYDRDETGSD